MELMTVTEFEATLPLLNISENRINAARAVLVQGESLSAVAKQYNCSRQAVHQSAIAVQTALHHYRDAQLAESNASKLLPRGWHRVTLTAPNHLIEKFRLQLAKHLPMPEIKMLENDKDPIENDENQNK
jgi:transposase-like protein